ncbi:MAG: HDOD domain-containing protein [Candidatus Saccharibacteria bacterium]|nr:HDOD domain-containing protein [Rhodoferax sp.]
MSPELSQRLTAAVESIPAFPKSVQRILKVTRDVNSTSKELVELIDKDPVVTVKILKVVNSAYYSLPEQITSIGNAVVYLWFNTIKNLTLSIAAIGMLPKDNESGFNAQQYLLHSSTTAGLAKQLAFKIGDADPMDCFIAGLLHDFDTQAIMSHPTTSMSPATMGSRNTRRLWTRKHGPVKIQCGV